ncbi:MAG TPA: hypothetical protein VGO55_11230 [Allosphingosinicella sp.]|jgi:hypothetical protein|nr:hypothetical protein [Allosphingosinicella sp.]
MWFLVTSEDLLATGFIFVLIALAGFWQARILHLRPALALAFTVSALFLALVRYMIEVGTPADAAGYYVNSLSWAEFDVGTELIPYLASFFTKGLNFGFLPTMMVFSVFGLMALQLFYAAFLKVGGEILDVRWHIVFLSLVVPSIGFWGSGISKESLVLLGLAIFCWALLKERRSLLLYGVGIALVTLIRPHIGVIMLCSLALAMLMSRGVKSGERLTILGIGGIMIAIVVPLAIEYIGFGNISSLDDVSYRVETWARGYEDTEAYLNISDMPLPLQVVTYLFRPFPWEAGILTQYIAALQNVILLAILALLTPRLFGRNSGLRTLPQMTFLIYAAVALLVLSSTTANLGIAARQKWMVVLPLLLALTHGLAQHKRREAGLRAVAVEPEPLPADAVAPSRS